MSKDEKKFYSRISPSVYFRVKTVKLSQISSLILSQLMENPNANENEKTQIFFGAFELK